MITSYISHLKTAILVLLALLALSVVTTPRAEAASLDQTTFTELQSQLELLRADLRSFRSGTSTRPRATSTRAVNRSCMQEAVNTRENTLADAFTTHGEEMAAAMEKRKTAFSSAWTGTEIRNSSTYKQVWSQWRRDALAARNNLQASRKAAWQTFRDTATRSCKATLPKEETDKQDAIFSAL